MAVKAKASISLIRVDDGNSIANVVNFYKVSSKGINEAAPQTSGGRNLILNSSFNNDIKLWTMETGEHTVSNDTTYGRYLSFSPNHGSRIYNNVINVWVENENYIYSFIAKADIDGVKIQPSRSISDYGSIHTLTTKWGKYTGTIKSKLTSPVGTLSFTTTYPNSKPVKIYITQVKLEKGSVATPWTPAPEDLGWSTTPPSLTPTNKYLWNYEMILGSDGQAISYTEPRVIGVYGDKGQNGATGNGVKGIDEFYQVSTSNSTPPTSWVSNPPTLTATNKYLWNYERINYTNGTSVETKKRVIGVYGDKGQTGNTGPAGPTGKGIKSTVITYQAGTSGTVTPTGSWLTNVPAVPQGQFLWSRTVVTYTDNTSSTSYSVAYIPKNGQNGATGPSGTGVANMIQQYYLSTSKETQTGGSWVTTMPTWSVGKYLWTRYQINYKNPTSTSYTSPVCDSSWEAVNEIQIGGRNLLMGTNKGVENWYWSMQTGGYKIEEALEDNIKGVKFTRDNTEQSGWSVINYSTVNLKMLKPSTNYTLSLEVKASVNADLYVSIRRSNSTDAISTDSPYFGKTINGKWVKKSVILRTVDILPTISDQTIYIKPGISTPGTIYCFRNIKLEFGNKATDWTPAPEDVQADIEKVRTEYKADLKVERERITSTVERVDTVETNLTNRISTAETKINQNADSISLTTKKTEDIKNNLSTNYYTKSQTDSKIKVESDRITSTVTKVESVEQKANAAYTKLDVLDTRYDNQPPEWYMTTYPMRSVNEFKSCRTIKLPPDNGTYCYCETTVPWGDPSGGYPKQVAKCDKNGREYYRYGISATMWSEWVCGYETASNALSQSNLNKSEISQLSKSISTLVTDENGTSLMKQTSDGWQFNISAIQNDLSNAANKLNELSGSVDGVNDVVNKLNSTITDLGKKTAYINVTTDTSGNPCLELGKTDDPFKVRITNKSMDFMDGTFKIAYISNQTLYIERALVKNELQIGEGNTGFIWKRRANGNLGLRKVR